MLSILAMVFSRRFIDGVYEGSLRGNGERVRLHYIGKGDSLAWLQHLLFDAPPAEHRKRLRSLLSLRLAGLPAPQTGLQVVEVTPLLERILKPLGVLSLPDWVEHVLDLQGEWSTVCRRFRKSTLTRDVPRIERCGFRWDVVNDRQSLEQFHDLQYAPLMADRHGEAGVLVSRDWLLSTTETHRLFRLWEGDQWVASALFRIVDDELDWILVGMDRQAATPHQRQIQGALYYHMIRYAHAGGFLRIRLGTTRPLLSDGVWLHKRKWGAAVVRSPQSETRLYLTPRVSSPGFARWLATHPWVTLESIQPDVKVCLPDSSMAQPMLACMRQGLVDGLSSIHLLTPVSDLAIPDTLEGISVHQVIHEFRELS